MPHGLPRKLRTAFILQAVMASFAVVIGVFIAASLVKDALIAKRLRAEAQNYWDGRAADPAYRLPVTSTVSAYFARGGGDAPALPTELAAYPPGLHELRDHRRHLLVDERRDGRLYLVMRFELVDSVIRWTASMSALLALLGIYASTWLTYRSSKRLVQPVSRLAKDVAGWDPSTSEGASFALATTPRDGSEVQQLGRALHDLSARVRDYVQRERDFTRDTSHELRTPLTVIRVATDMMLSDSDTSDRARRALARMQRAGRDMETVIDAFLILARDGDVEPVAEFFDVHDVIDDEIDKARFALASRPVELVVTLNASPQLHASPRVLALMFGNLLENACTFTEQGRIEVVVEHDRIVIHDTGIGMSPDVLQKVYEPFYRADPFNVGGKGMGLSVVRRLGERFGWPVTLQSTPDEGTTATIGFSDHRTH